MAKIVVTAGEKWVDIDAVACAIAYKELLALQGHEAIAVFPGPLNHSVSQMARAQGLDYATVCPEDVDAFVLVDISNPEHFASCVDLERVSEVYDHRAGAEQFWRDRLGDKARIDLIGACATLIWEAYVRAGFAERISSRSANLLSMAIVSNCLNFQAPITSQRDRYAFEQLKKFVTLPTDWVHRYFDELERVVFDDLATLLRNDTKTENVPELGGTFVIGQLELLDPRPLLLERRGELERILSTMQGRHWMLNLPSLSEGRNYVFTTNPETQILLQRVFGWQFDDGVAVTPSLVMRKMILKELLSLS